SELQSSCGIAKSLILLDATVQEVDILCTVGSSSPARRRRRGRWVGENNWVPSGRSRPQADVARSFNVSQPTISRLAAPSPFDLGRRELREIAGRVGCEIVKVYKDHGISGAKERDKRPAFDALCRDATKRQFDMVMAWSVDRLGRSLKDLVAFL